jgi:hypothetical protein
MYLDYAVDQAKLQEKIYMKDWRQKLDAFLFFCEGEVLKSASQIEKEAADHLTLEQYDMFHEHRLKLEVEQEMQYDDEELRKYLEE